MNEEIWQELGVCKDRKSMREGGRAAAIPSHTARGGSEFPP